MPSEGRVRTAVGTRSRTKQSFRSESDINVILAKYRATGVLEHWNRRVPRYGDFSSVPEYREALDRVKAAQQAFDQLPARVRKHCQNDPAELLQLALDPGRREELVALGLVPPGEAAPEPESDSGPEEVNR